MFVSDGTIAIGLQTRRDVLCEIKIRDVRLIIQVLLLSKTNYIIYNYIMPFYCYLTSS